MDEAAATSAFFRFSSAEKEAGSIGAGGSTIPPWANVPIGSSVAFATRLNYKAVNDELYGHIQVTVPDDEGSGQKDSTITFTASQSV